MKKNPKTNNINTIRLLPTKTFKNLKKIKKNRIRINKIEKIETIEKMNNKIQKKKYLNKKFGWIKLKKSQKKWMMCVYLQMCVHLLQSFTHCISNW